MMQMFINLLSCHGVSISQLSNLKALYVGEPIGQTCLRTNIYTILFVEGSLLTGFKICGRFMKFPSIVNFLGDYLAI